jgi:hypothetical protein
MTSVAGDATVLSDESETCLVVGEILDSPGDRGMAHGTVFCTELGLELAMVGFRMAIGAA